MEEIELIVGDWMMGLSREARNSLSTHDTAALIYELSCAFGAEDAEDAEDAEGEEE